MAALVDQYPYLSCDIPLLKECIQAFISSRETFTFYHAIKQAIKILENAGQLVRSQRNRYGFNVPVEMICKIFSFLSSLQDVERGKMVCKNWFNALNSDLFKKMRLNRKPKSADYLHSWATVGRSYLTAACQGKIISCEIGSLQGRVHQHLSGKVIDLVSFPYAVIDMAISENGSLIAHFNYFNEIQVYKRNKKGNYLFLYTWNTYDHCLGIAIQGETIYITLPSSVDVYSNDGVLLRSWSLREVTTEKVSYSRAVGLFKDQIFMSFRNYSFIRVFSITDGSLIREWKIRGSGDPGKIVVTSEAVFVEDTSGWEIQVFTHDGEFLFYVCPREQNFYFSNICSLDDKLYLTDAENQKIHIYNLRY